MAMTVASGSNTWVTAWRCPILARPTRASTTRPAARVYRTQPGVGVTPDRHASQVPPQRE